MITVFVIAAVWVGLSPIVAVVVGRYLARRGGEQ